MDKKNFSILIIDDEDSMIPLLFRILAWESKGNIFRLLFPFPGSDRFNNRDR